jgi:hypothetical protein
MDFFKYNSLSDFCRKPATDKASIISTNKLSIFIPMEYRNGLGNFKNNLFHSMYKSLT